MLADRLRLRELTRHESHTRGIRAPDQARIHAVSRQFARRLTGEAILPELEHDSAQQAAGTGSACVLQPAREQRESCDQAMPPSTFRTGSSVTPSPKCCSQLFI